MDKVRDDNKARFIRRISAVSNAIETIDNEMICFIICCLNCIRHGRNATYERGLRDVFTRPARVPGMTGNGHIEILDFYKSLA